MQLVKDKISVEELNEMSAKMFGYMVKAVIDVEQEIMAVGAQLHGDGESLLLDHGSQEDNVWGINIRTDNVRQESWIEFDSMINIKPFLDNKSPSIQSEQLRKKIVTIVDRLVSK